MKKILFMLAAGLMVSVMITGCGTEDPWGVLPPSGIALSIVSGPSGTVVNGSSVTFSWTSTGGEGEVTYRYQLGTAGWSEWSNVTSVTYDGVAGPITYTFNIEARDEGSGTASVSGGFEVSGTTPTITYTVGQTDGSYAATGGTLTFSWDSADQGNYGENLEFSYIANFAAGGADTSDWIPARTVTFINVEAADPALFILSARTPGGNVEVDTVNFTVRDANILYIDDFQWFDAAGNVDRPKERDQKQFYRNALEGYAFAEWDVAEHLSDSTTGLPDSSDLVVGGEPVYSTIVFCSDSDIGSTDGTWWYEVGAISGGGVIDHYLESGGNLLAAGPLVLYDMTQEYPPEPEPGHFEYDWFGIDSTSWCWDYWYTLSWVVKDTATTLSLPDSMKIDVGKNGDQDDYAIETPGLRDDATVTTEVIFTWGLWRDGSVPTPHGSPVGHIVSFDGTPQTAMLNFDVYSMPFSGIRQIFQTILTEFGE